jgi:hypothetical protein
MYFSKCEGKTIKLERSIPFFKSLAIYIKIEEEVTCGRISFGVWRIKLNGQLRRHILKIKIRRGSPSYEEKL